MLTILMGFWGGWGIDLHGPSIVVGNLFDRHLGVSTKIVVALNDGGARALTKTNKRNNPHEWDHLSHEKNPLTFHYTGCLIGILIMVYYNPYITG